MNLETAVAIILMNVVLLPGLIGGTFAALVTIWLATSFVLIFLLFLILE